MTVKEIFLSYSWNDKKLADQLDVLFHSKGILLKRDVRDLHYKISIKEFMKGIRRADLCLMLISEQFLKSLNCMYEVLEFVKDDNFKDKILPVLVGNIKIYNAIDRSNYIGYWQAKYEEIRDRIENVDTLNQEDLIKECRVVESISRTVGEFLGIISDLYSINIDTEVSAVHCAELLKVADPTIDQSMTLDIPVGFYLINVPMTIRENVFYWWKMESKGYTDDIREARVFLEDEVLDKFVRSEYNEWDNKKFVAVPDQ